MTRLALGVAALAAYTATIPTANWLITRYGAVPVGFGQTAPAGVYAAAAALTLRDAVHETLGRTWALVGIALGTALSLLLADPRIAAAAAAAFALSELADLAVYTPLRRHHPTAAIAASGAVGLAVDSVLFLWLAFGSLAYLPGQLIGKTWGILAAVAIVAAARTARRTEATA